MIALVLQKDKSCMKKIGLLDMCAHNYLLVLEHPNVVVINLIGNY